MRFVVVTGPPCSGKSTWIAGHARGSDVFSRPGLDNDPEAVRREREAFVSRHAGRPGTCYVETCRPYEPAVADGDAVERVGMDATEDDCLRNLEASDRADKARWRDVIRSHFSERGPARGPLHVGTSPHGDEGPHGPERRGRMADETEAPEAKPEEQKPQEEPQGTDWKAEARKWERRAKENGKSLDELQRLLDGSEAKGKDADARERKASEALEAAKAEIKRLKAEAERDRMVREVAKAKGVDADVLFRMRGDTKEEVEDNAAMLLASSRRSWPSVPDAGSTKATRVTKEQILAERNPQKQLRMIAENRDLFR